MYRAFELKVADEIFDTDWISSAISNGQNNNKSDKTDIEELLREVIASGTIDGTMLTERYFPALHRDVFLSYSHDDQKFAYAIAGMLDKFFNLSVFIDSLFWGSADKLLREIDNSYCLNKDGKTYNYDKRNFSTSHVHAMLTSAMMKAMDQSEIIIFLNTPNSAPEIAYAISNKGYDDYTLSPWIYEEVLLTTMLRETDWEDYRMEKMLNESALEHFEGNLRVKYKLPKEKLISLTLEDIYEWHDMYEKRKDREPGHYGSLSLEPWQLEKHPLNVLYEMKCGVDMDER